MTPSLRPSSPERHRQISVSYQEAGVRRDTRSHHEIRKWLQKTTNFLNHKCQEVFARRYHARRYARRYHDIRSFMYVLLRRVCFVFALFCYFCCCCLTFLRFLCLGNFALFPFVFVSFSFTYSARMFRLWFICTSDAVVSIKSHVGCRPHVQ